MSRIRKITIDINALCLLFIFAFLPVFLCSSPTFAKPNPKYASIIMEADSGKILEQQYADKRLHPASLTKVMTLLLLFDAIEDGKVRLNDRIRISRRAAGMQPSKIGFTPGETIRVKDAIYALVTKSANDVAVAVAEHLAGSESVFAKAMTKRAKEIGMSRTVFKNASGLHNRYQISTARDMAKMARYIIKMYPSYYAYFSRKTFTYRGKTYRNHNRLLGKYAGIDGFKTGYIRASGFNLIASAKRNGQRIIAVVFGGRSSKSRNAHMVTLLNRGFKKSSTLRIASVVAPLPPHKPNFSVLAAASNVPLPPIPSHRNEEIASADTFEGVGAEGSALVAAPASGEGASSAERDAEAHLEMVRASKSRVFKSWLKAGQEDLLHASSRVSTGILAINAHTGESLSQPILASYVPEARPSNAWSIQVGAFREKDQTNKALNVSLLNLPKTYRDVQPVISPLKTRSGWLFRARLSGYSKNEAFQACSYLKDCMPLAP